MPTLRGWRILVLLTLPLSAQDYEMIGGHRAVPGEVLVKYRNGGPGTRHYAAQQLSPNGVTHLRAAGKTTARLLKELSSDPEVEYAEPNYIVSIDAEPQDPLFSSQWALENTGQNGGYPRADIDMSPAWSITTGSRANVVGVVDTGIDYTHPDLQANVWSAPSAFTVRFGSGDSVTCPAGSHGYDAIRNTCDPMDQNGHGTHVSGIIGAAGNNHTGIAGVNWTASVLALRFMDASGNGTVANAVRAITFALQLKSLFPGAANLRVLSNSWGGAGYSQTLADAIKQANAAGVLFVAAAGNGGSNLDAAPSYPASYTGSNVVTVASTDNRDALASSSNYGHSTVHLGAPGVNILSTIRGGAWATDSGTSMAAPHVAGAAALLLAACTLDVAGLKQALVGNTDTVPALLNRTVTGGRLNVYRALKSCAPQSTSAGFTIAPGPASVVLGPGGSTKVTITVTGTGGFQGQVALAASGVPAGVSATLAPNVISPGGSATLQLTAAASTPATTSRITVTGTGGGLTSTATIPLTVSAPGFTLSAMPASLTVRRGAAASYTISAAGTGGFSGTVRMRYAGVPGNATASFSAAAGSALALRILTTTRTNPGTYAVVVTGISGQLTKTVSLTLQVTR